MCGFLDASVGNKGIIMAPCGGELNTSDNENTVSLHIDSINVAQF